MNKKSNLQFSADLSATIQIPFEVKNRQQQAHFEHEEELEEGEVRDATTKLQPRNTEILGTNARDTIVLKLLEERKTKQLKKQQQKEEQSPFENFNNDLTPHPPSYPKPSNVYTSKLPIKQNNINTNIESENGIHYKKEEEEEGIEEDIEYSNENGNENINNNHNHNGSYFDNSDEEEERTDDQNTLTQNKYNKYASQQNGNDNDNDNGNNNNYDDEEEKDMANSDDDNYTISHNSQFNESPHSFQHSLSDYYDYEYDQSSNTTSPFYHSNYTEESEDQPHDFYSNYGQNTSSYSPQNTDNTQQGLLPKESWERVEREVEEGLKEHAIRRAKNEYNNTTSPQKPTHNPNKPHYRQIYQRRESGVNPMIQKIDEVPNNQIDNDTNFNHHKIRVSQAKLTRLAQPKTEKIILRMKEREQKEEEEVKKLPFRPSINPPPSFVLAKKPTSRPTSPRKTSDRLFHEADKRLAEREKARLEMEEEEIKSYSFHPEINTEVPLFIQTENIYSLRPIYERAAELIDLKKQHLHELRAKRMKEEKDFTFHPTINPLSKEKVEISRAMSRLSLQDQDLRYDDKENQFDNFSEGTPENNEEDSVPYYQAEIDRKNKRRDRVIQEIQKEYTFAPKVSETSKQILAHSEVFQNTDFMDRLQLYEQAKRSRSNTESSTDSAITHHNEHENENSNYNDDSGNHSLPVPHSRHHKHENEVAEAQARTYTFKPYINPTTRELVSSKRSKSVSNLLDRLASVDPQKHQQQADSYYSQFSFKPQIDPVSRSIARGKTIEELYRDQQRKRVLEDARLAAEKAFQNSHTFHPSLPSYPHTRSISPSRSINIPSYPSSQRLQEKEAQKAEKMAAIKKEKEEKELRECTFTPRVNDNPPKQTDSVTVKGMDRFLEVREMARKQEEDRREREENAFKVKHLTPNVLPFTIPVPFHFHGPDPRVAERREKRTQEKEEKEKKHLTFRPDTNYVLKTKAIAKLLS